MALVTLSGALGLAKTAGSVGLKVGSAILMGPGGWVLNFFSALWENAFGRVVLIGGVCLIGGFVWGFSHEKSMVDAAVAARDAHWRSEIAAANREVDKKVKEALNAAKTLPATPSGADLVRLCQQDAACRKVAKR